MKITLHRTDKIEVDLKWLAQAVVRDIKTNMKYEWRESLEELVEARLDDCGCLYSTLGDLVLYDNYNDVLHTITNNMIMWCIAKNDEFYNTIMEYKKYLKI